MKLKEVITQTTQDRRDYRVLYKCEHCYHEAEGPMTDDTYFRQEVIPAMICPECGRDAEVKP